MASRAHRWIVLAACVTWAGPSFAAGKARPYRIVEPLHGIHDFQVVGVRRTKGGSMIANLRVSGYTPHPRDGKTESLALAPDTWTTVGYGFGVVLRLRVNGTGQVQKEYEFTNRERMESNDVLSVEIVDRPLFPTEKAVRGWMTMPGRHFRPIRLLAEEAAGFKVLGNSLVSETAGLTMRLGGAFRSVDGTRVEGGHLSFVGTPKDGQLHLGSFDRKQVTLQFDGDQVKSMSVVMPGR